MRIRGKLTPRFMQNSLVPFLDGLISLQHTIDDLKNSPPSTVTIRGISVEEDASGSEAQESQIGILRRERSYEQLLQAWQSLKELVAETASSDEPEGKSRAASSERRRLYEDLLREWGALVLAELADEPSTRSLVEYFSFGRRPWSDLVGRYRPQIVHISLPEHEEWIHVLTRFLPEEEEEKEIGRIVKRGGDL